MIQSTPYAFGLTLPLPFDDAVARVRAALATQGFGVLSEIDVAATLRAKLGADMRPYLILGACNPPLAQRAIQAEPEIGTLLPCNVVLWEGSTAGETVVRAMDPIAALGLTGNAAVEPIAREVRQRLERALEAASASLAPAT